MKLLGLKSYLRSELDDSPCTETTPKHQLQMCGKSCAEEQSGEASQRLAQGSLPHSQMVTKVASDLEEPKQLV